MQGQENLFPRMRFEYTEDEIIRDIQIGREGDFVSTKVKFQDKEFNDIRDWWKTYLSQDQQTKVKAWSGKGKELNVAELFSGPGGLAQGVKTFCDDIGVKFQSIAALDMNRDALRVYERNHKTQHRASVSDTDWESHKGDVTKLVTGEWKNPKVFKRLVDTHKEKGRTFTSDNDWKILKESHRGLIEDWKKKTEKDKKVETRPTLSMQEIDADYKQNKPTINKDGPWKQFKRDAFDLLLAGPPCQGHSNLNNHTRRDDEKNELYLIVPAVAIAWNIPLVIIENVEGVIHDVSGVVQQTEGIFKANGYKVERGVLNAAKMGWPQTRKRYFLIARKKGAPIAIKTVMESFSIPEKSTPLTVRHAIEDLMEEKIFTRGDKRITDHMLTIPNYSDKEIARAKYHTAGQRKTKKAAVEMLRDAFLAEHKKNNYQNLSESRIKENFKIAAEEIEERFTELNADWNLPTRLHNETHWEATSYPTVYGRLDWDMPSGTITSGYMCSGRGRFTHPKQARTLTPREAARLQGFPDSYDWKPEDDRIPSATDIAQWIGDAVPMPLGYAAAYSVLGNGLDFK